VLPIPGLLDDEPFDAETKRIIRLAFEAARVAIDPQSGHHDDAILAKRVIELAKEGELNPDVLCEKALRSFRMQRIER
jgi:hypothetical protein